MEHIKDGWEQVLDRNTLLDPCPASEYSCGKRPLLVSQRPLLVRRPSKRKEDLDRLECFMLLTGPACERCTFMNNKRRDE